MAKERKKVPQSESIISRYARAKARGEDPEPPVFFRPGDEESIQAFVERLYEAIHGQAPSDEEVAEIEGEISRLSEDDGAKS